MEKRRQIEFIGACATIIYELLKNKTPTTTTTNLLSTAIFANTLNFKSKITTERDIIAYNKLKKHTDLPENLIEQYYNKVESVMFSDILSTIKNDTKILQNSIIISQIELWEADKMLNKLNFLETLNYSMNNYKNWLMNMSSIKCGKTYFIAKSQNIKNILHNCLGVIWNDNIGITNRLYLRKEVIKNCGWDK